jgi:hypothetical protein
MIAARYAPVKHRPSARQYRLLCGAAKQTGVPCGGDLGRLFQKNEAARTGLLIYFVPLVSGSLAPGAQGVWSESRQRRPFVSGIDGGRNVGGGVSTGNVLRDAQGRPLKWLPALVEVAGKDQVILECPRCHEANAVRWADAAREMERRLDHVPLAIWSDALDHTSLT